MKPLAVLGERVKLRRKQLPSPGGGGGPMTQAELAAEVVKQGASMNATTVLRIEKGTGAGGKKDGRSVHVDELLALAAALSTTPADLLAPSMAKTLTIGDHELDAAQVLAWFAGDADVVRRRRAAKSLKEILADANMRQVLGDIVEGVELISEAIERGDGAAMLWATGRVHNSLAALVERRLPAKELQRIWQDFNVTEGE